MQTQVGLWIDHRQAVVVRYKADQPAAETIESNVEENLSAYGGGRSSSPYGPQDVVAQDNLDRKVKQHLQQYYDRVAQSLGDARSIFIIGPAGAKTEFKNHLEKSKRQPQPKIRVEPADKMSEVQIIDKIKTHFGWQPEI